MKAQVTVTLKQDVLDPQGTAILRACESLGHAGISRVRQGKFFEIELHAADEAAAQKLLAELSEKLLANPVIEDYQIVRLES